MQAYLLLENGAVFSGTAFGAIKEVTAEVVFTTSVTGFLETLTDPSYFGQAVVQTFPLVGNYGIISSDFESDNCFLSAYIVRSVCDEPSNFRCEGEMDAFLKSKGIPGISGIDTRSLAKMIRENGTLKGFLTYDDPTPNAERLAEQIKAYEIKGAVKAVTSKAKAEKNHEEKAKTVALYDFGVTNSFKNLLFDMGYNVISVPATTSAKEILQMNVDGVVLSAGPGNPEENTEIIAEIKALMEKKIPMFGIGLGHQIMALAGGAKVEKLKFGHRGSNQPVKVLENGKMLITNQNHGFTVSKNELPDTIEIMMENANDHTIEGLLYKDLPCVSVQFTPVVCAGPQDNSFLFEKFNDSLK